MSSAEPKLKQFELEIAPRQFRLAVLSGDNMLLGYKPGGTGQPRIVITRYKDHEQEIEAMLESVHWLLVANGVMDTPVKAPNCSFNPMYMQDPSVHILIGYTDGRQWGSMYPLSELPENIRSLVEQAQYLAVTNAEAASGEASPAA